MQQDNNTPPPARYDDEISLVDLAKILIRRWKLMALVFLAVVGGALAYALTITRSFEYVSIYQVAEQVPNEALESPGSVIARIQNLYVPPLTRELRAEADMGRLPFGVSVENPENTLLVRLTSEAAEEHGGLVEEMHEQLLAHAQEEQASLLERHQARLEQRLESAERALEAIEQANSMYATELIANYTHRIASIEEQLAQLEEGRIVQTAVQSVAPTGTRRSLIMALAIVLGGMLAIMAAFFAQFAAAVRASLQEEQT